MNNLTLLATMKKAQKPAHVPTLEQATRYLTVLDCNPELLAYLDEKETLCLHQEVYNLMKTNTKAAYKLIA
jgi:hypothetical protein